MMTLMLLLLVTYFYPALGLVSFLVVQVHVSYLIVALVTSQKSLSHQLLVTAQNVNPVNTRLIQDATGDGPSVWGEHILRPLEG